MLNYLNQCPDSKGTLQNQEAPNQVAANHRPNVHGRSLQRTPLMVVYRVKFITWLHQKEDQREQQEQTNVKVYSVLFLLFLV